MFILKSRFCGRCAGLINEQRYTILSDYFKYVLDFNFVQYIHVFRWADSKNVIIVIIFNELCPLYDCKGFLARRPNLPYLNYNFCTISRKINLNLGRRKRGGWWVGLGVGNLPGNSRNIPRNFWNFRNGPDLLTIT